MLNQALNNPKHWGWLLDDAKPSEYKTVLHKPDPLDDTKDYERTYLTFYDMPLWQMMGVNGHNPNKRLRQSTLFRPQKIDTKLEQMLYSDNPKFIDNKRDINVPKGKLFYSGYHAGTP